MAGSNLMVKVVELLGSTTGVNGDICAVVVVLSIGTYT